MNYKPYSLEWTRKRYLSESIQQYFNTDASVETILEDILDVLNENASSHRDKAEKFEEVLRKLK